MKQNAAELSKDAWIGGGGGMLLIFSLQLQSDNKISEPFFFIDRWIKENEAQTLGSKALGNVEVMHCI